MNRGTRLPMDLHQVLAILAVLLASSRCIAQANEVEWFSELAISEDGPTKAIQWFRYDFTTGQRQPGDIVARFDKAQAVQVARNSGAALVLKSDLRGRDETSIDATQGVRSSVVVSLKDHGAAELLLPSLSPDGKGLVAFDAEKGKILLVVNESMKNIMVGWSISHPFSWSPDSQRVAFYFATSRNADDSKIQQHGVAVIDRSGNVRVVRDPLPDYATGLTDAKDVPIGWGNSNTIYFTEGRVSSNITDNFEMSHGRIRITMAADIETGTCEIAADGEFCDIAPDGSYILTNGSVKQEGKSIWKCWKTDLKTKLKEDLGGEVSYPKISPSGKRVACISTDGTIVCLSSENWKRIGNPVPTGRSLLRIVDWSTQFGWSTLESR